MFYEQRLSWGGLAVFIRLIYLRLGPFAIAPSSLVVMNAKSPVERVA